MRVILDTDVYVSYLIAPRSPHSTIHAVVDGALDGEYTVLLPAGLIDELAGAMRSKPKLRRMLGKQELWEFIHLLEAIGKVLPAPVRSPGAVTRDVKDDYLYLSAQQGEADYLVTGDLDPLALALETVQPRVVTPGEFLRIIKGAQYAAKAFDPYTTARACG